MHFTATVWLVFTFLVVQHRYLCTFLHHVEYVYAVLQIHLHPTAIQLAFTHFIDYQI